MKRLLLFLTTLAVLGTAAYCNKSIVKPYLERTKAFVRGEDMETYGLPVNHFYGRMIRDGLLISAEDKDDTTVEIKLHNYSSDTFTIGRNNGDTNQFLTIDYVDVTPETFDISYLEIRPGEDYTIDVDRKNNKRSIETLRFRNITKAGKSSSDCDDMAMQVHNWVSEGDNVEEYVPYEDTDMMVSGNYIDSEANICMIVQQDMNEFMTVYISEFISVDMSDNYSFQKHLAMEDAALTTTEGTYEVKTVIGSDIKYASLDFYGVKGIPQSLTIGDHTIQLNCITASGELVDEELAVKQIIYHTTGDYKLRNKPEGDELTILAEGTTCYGTGNVTGDGSWIEVTTDFGSNGWVSSSGLTADN